MPNDAPTTFKDFRLFVEIPVISDNLEGAYKHVRTLLDGTGIVYDVLEEFFVDGEEGDHNELQKLIQSS